MSWEFDYARAWRDWAKPEFETLSPELKSLLRRVCRICGHPEFNADSQANAFMSVKDALQNASTMQELAKAITVVYYYGHWNSDSKDLYSGHGAYWQFVDMVKQAYISRFPGPSNDWKTVYKMPELQPRFYTHVEGTPLDNEELAEKYRQRLSPRYAVVDVCNVNFRPHPFMIGEAHFPKDGSMYIKPESAPCAMPGCGLSYEQHTSDKALLLRMNAARKSEARELLAAEKDELQKDGITGVALVPEEKHEHEL